MLANLSPYSAGRKPFVPGQPKVAPEQEVNNIGCQVMRVDVSIKAGVLMGFCFWLTSCGDAGLTSGGDKNAETSTSAHKPAGEWTIFRGNPALTGVAQGELNLPLQLLWTFKTGGPVNSSPVVASGRVFFGSGDSNVYAADLHSGEQLWAFDAGDVVDAPPLALNGLIYVGTQSGKMLALNAADGQPVWSYQTGDKILSSANWSAEHGKTNVLFGSYDYILHCVDAATGKSNWVYESGNYINGTPAVEKGRAVFGGCDAVLHVVSTHDGAKLAEIAAGAYVAASVALADGTAYYGHYENEFQAVDLKSGKTAWKFRERSFPYFSSAAITSDRVLFGGRDKRLHCVTRSDGTPVWQFATRGKVDSSPVVCGETVIVGSDDGRVYVVSIKDGNELWSYEIGQPVGTSPAVAQGKVIVGSEDGSVYCFGVK